MKNCGKYGAESSNGTHFRRHSIEVTVPLHILVSYSQAIAYDHPKVFPFTLLLSEGQTGEAWEPSNKTILFLPPHNNMSLTFPRNFHFHLLFCYTFCLSLSPRLPERSDSEIWSWVSWNSHPRITMLTRTSSNLVDNHESHDIQN
jgi:hypothetical protein